MRKSSPRKSPVLKVRCARPGCRKRFVPGRPWARFCSPSCRLRDFMENRYGTETVKKLESENKKLRLQLRERKRSIDAIRKVAQSAERRTAD
jgi:endogenous inhibitor of DNA gyrase (YacG/DUF329 family)